MPTARHSASTDTLVSKSTTIASSVISTWIAVRLGTRRLERRPEIAGWFWVEEVERGQIHGDRDRHPRAAAKVDGALDDELRESSDQAGLRQERHELGRGHFTVNRVIPAGQCLSRVPASDDGATRALAPFC